MLLRPVSPPPPRPHFAAARRSAAPAPAPFFLLLRRHRRRHRLLLRASLSDLLASIPASLSLVGPAAVAAAAAVASSFTSSSSYSRSGLPLPTPEPEHGECEDDAGEWVLFTSPTPFNRSVLLRCPSVSFEDGGLLLDGVNERLLTEERHYVNLSRGRIPAARAGDGSDDLAYQRVCIPLEDGGVIALDWPQNLDLDKEHGLDSTLLIVPGTPQGSMERGIKMFVLDALKNGYFPVVMNPRGCGGSPLTTPRLFTAADSDDICATTRFIKSKRPWTTLMGVGWGYGANMLTKYLVEVGDSTPLTAAVCIDNPFDLQEATRSFPHHIALDQKLTAGLVDILRANKELFQGKAKDFDVQRALSATCLRDFDGAISMVSHGFSTVDDFYSENSTRLSVAHVKIPVLFIQSDDGTVPLLSVPRSSISENPFTSLLLCSCIHSTVFTLERYAVLWCQNLTLEWLSGVEFAFLKGRHPLIKDVDITINPSKGLAFVEPQPNDRKVPEDNSFPRQSQFILYNNVPRGTNGLLVDSVNGNSGPQNNKNVLLKGSADIDRTSKAADEKDLEESSEDVEKGHVLQSASVVMNMLDATMPGTLDDDQKNKVLGAVEQGESLMKALEEAVPEDVRGKLTTSVTEILQSKRENFSLDALKRLGWTNVRSTTNTAVQEKVKESDYEGGLKDARMLDQRSVTANTEGDQKDTNVISNDNSPGEGIDPSQGKPSQTSGPVAAVTEMESEQTRLNKSEKVNSGTSESRSLTANTEGDQKDTNVISNDDSPGEGIDPSQGKPSQTSGPVAAVTEMESEQTQLNKSEKVNSGTSESSEEQHSTDKGSETVSKHVSDDQLMASSNGAPSEREQSQSGDAIAEQNPHSLATEKEEDAVLTSEDKAANNVADESTQVSKTEESKAPPVTVTQALDALTGFDDSTQMAVNSVYGVLENMIDQFEKQHDAENGDNSDGTTDEPSLDDTESQEAVDMENDLTQQNINPSSSYQAQDSIPGKGHPIISEEKFGDIEISEDITFGDRDSNLSIISAAQRKIRNYQRDVAENCVDVDVTKQDTGLPGYLLDIAANSYLKAHYAFYLHEFLSTQLPLKSRNLNSATDLFLDPQEGKWKLEDEMENVHKDILKSDKHSSTEEEIVHADSSQAPSGIDNVIDPAYSVLTNFADSKSNIKERKNTIATKLPDNALREAITCFIGNELESALKLEVGRKLGITNTEQLERSLAHDVERIAAQVSMTIVRDCELFAAALVQRNPTTVKFGVIHGENVVEAVSTAVQQSHDLRNVLPVGVILGVTLASLRNHFHVGISYQATIESVISNEDLIIQDAGKAHRNKTSSKREENTVDHIEKTDGYKLKEMAISEGKGMMVGAVTAALGASAFVAHHQQMDVKHDSSTTCSQEKLDETAQEKSETNLVSSFAEKAMSVAAPVVPTKGDGEVDHERLVAVLAELGQKGGILRFVGKIALLWGGIRGAMSLTDRLILFLRLSERPLFQRIMGFSFMVLVLWSPVVIPLLPSLVQSWTISASTGIVGYACIVGLYVAIMILVMIWGKRIRDYENPVEQYGMNLASASRLQEFFQGLVGGVVVVGLVHTISILLGFATFRAGSSSFLARPIDILKSSSNVLLALRGFITATSIAVVEEVVFRSWLPEEIAVDLGYYQAILISGVAFSLIHRSLPSLPGFILLSLVLFGLKQRTQGNLAAPIGLHSGIMTASYLIQSSGVVSFKPETPFWMTSTYHLHPFDGVIGLSICSLLAIVFFPQKPVQKDTSVS